MWRLVTAATFLLMVGVAISSPILEDRELEGALPEEGNQLNEDANCNMTNTNTAG